MSETDPQMPNYVDWNTKGDVHQGIRITLMTPSSTVAVGNTVQVWHVYEAVEPAHALHVMGPKPVPGEYVDGILRTELPPGELPYPWQALYDGAVLPGPGIDSHWEISTYTFDAPGQHTIQWKVGELESNVLVVEVVGK